LTAWTKIYGMGVHNSDIPATFGWSMAWRFQRALVADFTGQPLIATRVTISANKGQKSLTLAEVAEIARTLGLRNRQSDPNMDGAPLWPGDHLSLRYLDLKEPSFEETAIEIWTDQDPTGGLPQEE
jgi:hypothetical protein